MKHSTPKHRVLRVANAPQITSPLLRQIAASGHTSVALPHAPASLRQASPKPHASKQISKHSSNHSHQSRGGSHSLTPDQITQIVLTALAGGPLRLAIQTIAEQTYAQLQQRQASVMNQGGSYQRQGGF